MFPKIFRSLVKDLGRIRHYFLQDHRIRSLNILLQACKKKSKKSKKGVLLLSLILSVFYSTEQDMFLDHHHRLSLQEENIYFSVKLYIKVHKFISEFICALIRK